MSETALHREASAVTLYRPVGPDGRAYTVMEGSRELIAWRLRMAQAVGYIGSPAEGAPYAVLDVLNDANDIVQDFPIPTAQAFRWWYRRIGARVVVLS